MEQRRCVITLYEFYAGSGLYRNVYSISRVAPYTIKEEQSEKLVPNDFRGFYWYYVLTNLSGKRGRLILASYL